jgi:hypothetical protein
MYLDWFKTLPLFYETESFRAVHACWDSSHIDYLKEVLVDYRLTDNLIYQSVKKGSKLNEAIEQTLKGKELNIPDGIYFTDKGGENRNEFRIKWWENPSEMTYKSISVEQIENLPELPILASEFELKDFYSSEEKIVFFGHYWLTGAPSFYKKNICCLDYSVAKGGKLVSYRFDGEKELDENKFVFV